MFTLVGLSTTWERKLPDMRSRRALADSVPFTPSSLLMFRVSQSMFGRLKSPVNIVVSRVIQIVLDRREYFLEAGQFSPRWAVDRSNYRV